MARKNDESKFFAERTVITWTGVDHEGEHVSSADIVGAGFWAIDELMRNCWESKLFEAMAGDLHVDNLRTAFKRFAKEIRSLHGKEAPANDK